MLTKKEQRLRRSRQTRIRIATQGVARLTVNRTNLHIYASVISGDGTKILAAASTAEVEVRKEIGASGKGGNVAAAQAIGKRIAEKAKLSLSEEQKNFLDTLTSFNIKARYDDYKLKFYTLCTKKFASEHVAKIKEFRLWIKKML